MVISPEKVKKFTTTHTPTTNTFYANVSTSPSLSIRDDEKHDSLLVKFEESSNGYGVEETSTPSQPPQRMINFGSYELFLLLLTQFGYLPVAASLLATTFFEPQKSLCTKFSNAPSNATTETLFLNRLAKRSNAFRSLFFEFVEDEPMNSLCTRAATLNFRLTFAIMLGGICGSFISGYLADRCGRKPVTLGTLILLAFTNLALIIFAPNGFNTALFIFFLMGLACGGYMVTNIVFILEAIRSQRTRLLVASLNGWPIGMIFTGFIGWLCSDWRVYAACVSGTATSLSFLLHSRSFESVGWLSNRQKLDKAEQIRRRIQKQNQRLQLLQLPKNLSFKSFDSDAKSNERTPQATRLLNKDEVQVEREMSLMIESPKKNGVTVKENSKLNGSTKEPQKLNGSTKEHEIYVGPPKEKSNGTCNGLVSDKENLKPNGTCNGLVTDKKNDFVSKEKKDDSLSNPLPDSSSNVHLYTPEFKFQLSCPDPPTYKSTFQLSSPDPLPVTKSKTDKPKFTSLPSTPPSLPLLVSGENVVDVKEIKIKKKQMSYVDLFKNAAIRRPLLALLFSFMTSSVVSFGFYFTADSMSGSRYLNLALMGVLKFSLGILPFALSFLVSKKRIILCSVGFGSIACWYLAVSCTWIEGAYQSMVTTILGLLITASMDPTWKVSHLYSVELFPTSVRTMARGTCNVTARLGSMGGPLIILFRTYNPVLPYWLFAILLSLQLIVLFCFMPKETNMGKEEAEAKRRSIEVKT